MTVEWKTWAKTLTEIEREKIRERREMAKEQYPLPDDLSIPEWLRRSK